ncbi:hypothetical protein GW17_00054412 [Ensete ventricosum]|nr:hypothetical protein GW17_00054412 [Ensete ventricosum]
MATRVLLFLLALLLHDPLASVAVRGFPVRLRDSRRLLSFAERFLHRLWRSQHRKQVLEAMLNSGIAASVEWGAGEYLIDLAIGTAMLPITAVLSTGSDLIWTQCGQCHDYEGGTNSLGILANETLTFGGKTPFAGITFGCGTENTGSLSNSTGIVGMGRGPLSLPSQLHPSKFSYCFTPFNSSTISHLFLGSIADLGSCFVHSTPIVLSSNNYPFSSFYYLSLQGISVGDTLLPIPNETFQIKADGSGGLIVDTGTVPTYLEEAGYDILRKELISRVDLPVANQTYIGLDLCFSLPPGSSSPPAMPDMIFHFDGADMTIPPQNYMSYGFEEGLFCFMITGMTGLSVLGNYQQQNLHVLFDLDADVLSFVPAMCDGL